MLERRCSRFPPLSVIFILMLFMVIMVCATAVAYTHRSGITGLDMGRVYQMRSQKHVSVE